MTNINWGIIGCGSIAHTFAKGLAKLNSGTLYAIASNNPTRATDFATTHLPEKTYQSYQVLVEDSNVDAVYIATTHNFHYENIKLCLSHGKHVLCEKPLTINARQTADLIKIAKNNNVFLMEAVWTRFLPAIKKLQHIIADGVIGDIKTLKANFSITGDFQPSHRLLNLDLAGGALLDLGIYPITFAHLVFGAHPSNIKSSAVIGKTGVDESSFYLFEYNNDQRAILSSSFVDSSPTEAIITGTKGYISIPEFLGAKELNIHVHNKEPQKLLFERTKDENFIFEIEHANQCINENRLESPIFSLLDTLNIMKTMDTLRDQWGLIYQDD